MTDVKDLQLLNNPSLICVTKAGIDIEVNLTQYAKVDLPNDVTVEGMSIEVKA